MQRSIFGAAFLLGGTFLSGAASAQCPSVGNDTGCGAVITVTSTGATVTQTGMGPYDGSDDTLIGVVNNIPACMPGQNSQSACGLPIFSIDLSSTANIFSFDGDGISSSTFGIPGNSKDSTQYGGPNAYFTNINAAGTSGRVNFITPIPPGGTGFFSLENVLNALSGCTNLLNNSVPKPADGSTQITTTFTPRGNDPNTGQPFTLAAAATACGFIGWDWQQTITNLPTPTPGNAFNAIATPNTAPVTPFNDPPSSGYNYMLPVPPGPLDAPQLSVYWDPFNGANSDGFALSSNETASVLTFFDAPADPCLPGAQSAATAAIANRTTATGGCGGPGVRAPAGSTINFTTHLAGFQGQFPGASVVDTGIGFSWTSTFNGTNGGIATLPTPTNHQVDAGSGTGGVTVTSYNGISNYIGVSVSGVNGSNVLGPSPLLAAVLPASRSVQVNGTATAFATIINSGATAAPGCSIAPASTLPLTFHYQTTNPQTNQVSGTADTPVNIAAGQSQSFVIGLTPTAAISPTNLAFNFACSNVAAAPVVVGLNTLLLSGSTTPTPDVVALSATATNDGILHIPGSAASGAFATATVNVGSGGTITASANTGSATLPLVLALCQTNPSNGQCLATPAATVTTTINANAMPTFSIFATSTGAIPFDPANSRIFVNFADQSGAVRGATSVAVQTQ